MKDTAMDLSTLFHDEVNLILRLLAGMAAGVVIGIDRTRHRKTIGVRTFGLVGLGTAAITAAFAGADTLDPASRVVQGLLTGIGFLGAGVILHRHDAPPIGLTTAAAVWVTAALGAAAGLGSWAVVITGTILALLLLLANERLERLFGRPEDDASS